MGPGYEHKVCVGRSSSRLLCGSRDFKFPKEWYSSMKELPFENTTMAVPVNYEDAIKVYYGENYMTPVRFAQSHDYPLYKRQEEFLNEHGIYTK